jgi:hypothetical protein
MMMATGFFLADGFGREAIEQILNERSGRLYAGAKVRQAQGLHCPVIPEAWSGDLESRRPE